METRTGYGVRVYVDYGRASVDFCLSTVRARRRRTSSRSTHRTRLVHASLPLPSDRAPDTTYSPSSSTLVAGPASCVYEHLLTRQWLTIVQDFEIPFPPSTLVRLHLTCSIASIDFIPIVPNMHGQRILLTKLPSPSDFPPSSTRKGTQADAKPYTASSHPTTRSSPARTRHSASLTVH